MTLIFTIVDAGGVFQRRLMNDLSHVTLGMNLVMSVSAEFERSIYPKTLINVSIHVKRDMSRCFRNGYVNSVTSRLTVIASSELRHAL
jgi:hypothetical protein